MNQPCSIELLFDKCQVGQSSYGEYYLYAVRNGDGQTEYSFFAPTEVHDKLKDLKKGDRAKLLKRAEQRGSKIITVYEVEVEKAERPMAPVPNSVSVGQADNFYDLMLQSCKDAVKIQNELGGLMDAKSVAVTLFIARSRCNGYGGVNVQ
ncbi:MAG: hypothetical protein LWX56_00650 [Ignavibacteria bacterium]|nr:hypothetical protein [Ignavibacteria bacterium]